MITRVLERNKRKYYYLEHSTRDGDKVVIKRKYLGKSLPKDVEKIKFEFMVKSILEKHGRKLAKIRSGFAREFSKYPKSAREKYLESFMVKFTYNTNRIEGGTLTLRETADLLQEQITPKSRPLPDIKEAEAHKKLFYEMLGYKKELSMGTVLYWHKMLLQNTKPDVAGRVRDHPVQIARSRFAPPLPAELDSDLHAFFRWYGNNRRKIHPFLLASLVHLKFVTIHPFTDGNGRISRLMMNFVLRKNGWPMINIEYSNRNSYYNALERSQVGRKEETFLLYMAKRYLKEYKRYVG